VECFLDQEIKGGALDSLTTAIHRQLPKKTPWGTVFESLMSLAGVRLTEDLLESSVWRLVGNLERLFLRHPAVPWCRQEVDEVVPVQVLAVHYGYSSRWRFGGDFELRVLAGTPASMLLRKFWTLGYCQMLKGMFGFSSPRGLYPFEDMRQFVNLRFSIRITLELSGASPDFEKIWQENDRIKPASLYEWNRQMLRHRRREDFRCPRDYDREEVKCHFCAVGQDECEAATHDETYEQRHCHACDKVTWFDPADSQQELCLTCHRESLRQQDE